MAGTRVTAPAKDPLGISSLLRIFFALSMALLVVLALAPAKSYFTEWREHQGRYNQIAASRGLPPVDVGIKQIWKPKLDVTDRCVSCHLGMGVAEPIPGHKLFGPHPAIPHDPMDMGCVKCHQGQGRATTARDAHGWDHHAEWATPVIETKYAQAGCGTCHSTAKAPTKVLAAKGEYLFDLHGCGSCHVVDGVGGVVGPDLTGVGLKGFDKDWHIRHLIKPENEVAGSRMMNFGHLTDDELDALVAYMDSLIGAPKWMAGKLLVNSHGCRGCHSIQGSGGDAAPSLDEIASKPAHDLHLPDHTGPVKVGAWHAAHLRDPGAVVPNSKMPKPALNEEEIEQVTTYLLSLRKRELPLGVLPKAEAVARIQGDKDHATDGAALFGTYCAACHGSAAQGMVLDELETRVPGVGGHDFLAVASDDFLMKTLEVGRPGRNMPGWAGKEGGLSTEEIRSIIGYLRSMEPEPPSFEAVMAADADVELGRRVFTGTCASCHGGRADGTVVGPSLVNDEFLTIASDEFLYETIVQGRAGTAMPAHRDLAAEEVRGLMAFLDSHRSKPKVDVSDYRASGSQSYGKVLYEAHCASCHGRDGGGGIGPAVGNKAFLDTASDGFLAASIREGRGNRAMRAFGKGRGGIVDLHDREIDDIVTYMRTWQSMDRGVLKGRVQGSENNGEELFGAMCAGCHGVDGVGNLAPALNNQGFLDAASDGFLQATILKGRAGTAMRSWGNHGFAELTPQEVNDLTSYIRSWDKERPR